MLLFDDILTLDELEFYSNNILQENTEPYIFDKTKKPKNLQEELILKISMWRFKARVVLATPLPPPNTTTFFFFIYN